jgi:hypothetical protein
VDEKLVTVSTFVSTIEANLARNRLEREGIPAVLSHESSAGNPGILSNTLGEVQLQVAEENQGRALASLGSDVDGTDSHREGEQSTFEKPVSESEPSNDDEEEDTQLMTDRFKKIAGPVIWIGFLGPTLFFLALAVLMIVVYLIREL